MLPFTRFRLLHWALAAVFLLAYLTGDDGELLHVWAGYGLILLLTLRLLAGLFRLAGFSPLLPRPATLAARNAGTLSRILVLAMVLFMAGTVTTGVLMVDNAKILGLSTARNAQTAYVDEGTALEDEERIIGPITADDLADLHEFLANTTLALTGLHIALLLGWRRPMALATLFGTSRRRPPVKPVTPTSSSIKSQGCRP